MTKDARDDLLLRSAHIQSAQPMLWAALALAVVAPLALLFRAEPLAIVGWLGGWIAAPAAPAASAKAAVVAHPRSAENALPVLRLVAAGVGDGKMLQMRVR